MKQLLPVWILVCWLQMPASAQSDSSFRLLRVMKGDIVEFTVDNLDNLYVLNSRNQVKKYNINGDSVAVYNDVRRFGRATLIDVSNPLKILLYYRDFATVVMLDRFLNAVNTIDLRRQNIFQAKAIGQSYDNKIWVYDEVENKLKKVDEEGKLLQETPDFRQLMDTPPAPSKIFDANKFVYVYDPSLGVFVFDYFGMLKTTIPLKHWQNVRVAGTYLYGSVADSLFRYSLPTLRTETWKLPPALRNSRSFSFSNTRLYALHTDEGEKNTGIYIYTLR